LKYNKTIFIEKSALVKFKGITDALILWVEVRVPLLFRCTHIESKTTCQEKEVEEVVAVETIMEVEAVVMVVDVVVVEAIVMVAVEEAEAEVVVVVVVVVEEEEEEEEAVEEATSESIRRRMEVNIRVVECASCCTTPF